MAGNDNIVNDDMLRFDPRAAIKEPFERTVSRLIPRVDSDEYAWDAILILLFNHIDLLGYLLSGDFSKANRAKWAVKFIRTYLGKVDEKYAMAGGFLYYMLGNGLMHKSYPGSFNTGDGRMLRFEFSSAREKQKHLSVTHSDNEVKLMFSVNIFYQDLLGAIDLYCLDLGTDRTLLDRYQRVWSKLTEPEERSQIRNHAYILESDFGFISDQIT